MTSAHPIDDSRTLAALLQGEAVDLHGAAATCRPTRVVEDSRRVGPGDVFLARPGKEFDGRRWIEAARTAGAIAILTDRGTAGALEGASIGADDPAAVGARLAHAVLGHPSHELSVVGVTGTNGKSTCALLLKHVFESSSLRCGLIGGIEVYDGAAFSSAALTTPEACDVAALLATMRDARCGHAAMEVSSQGIARGRVEAVRFSAGIFTNLSGDHLDLHGDLETYAAIKGGWINALPDDAPRVINIDDEVGAELARSSGAGVITCGQRGDARVDIRSASLEGQEIDLQTPWGRAQATLPLLGACNAFNALQVVTAACALGCDLDCVSGALAGAPIPRGRLQPIQFSKEGPSVLVDFAHTDGALESALRSVRPLLAEEGRLVVVIGCGGDRDATKRPRMAAVASALADVVWLTSDNPRGEDPEAILDAMERGVPAEARGRVMRRIDRRAAIADAVAGAGPRDLVLVAGKGHETVQIQGGHAEPFDDAIEAQAALARWESEHA